MKLILNCNFFNFGMLQSFDLYSKIIISTYIILFKKKLSILVLLQYIYFNILNYVRNLYNIYLAIIKLNF